MDEALEHRITARPADAVEHGIAGADGSDELLRLEPRQENAMVGGVQAERRKGALKALPKQRGDLGAAGKLDEGELAIAGVAGDAWKNLIVLRQIFGQRLGAPEHGGTRTQTKRRAIGGGRRDIRRLV